MRELDFIEIIKNTVEDSTLIGDDCACLEDSDLYITQDTLVEDVHFSPYTITPYLLGRKSVSVNLSDLAAALAIPKYISVSLSLPEMTKNEFVSELYRGINDVCKEYGVKITGGDITGSEKTVISVTAIGKKNTLFNVSRKYAKKDYVIAVTGDFGSSAAGFYALSQFLMCPESLKEKHFNPIPRIKEGQDIALLTDTDIAATDSSDGLIPSLFNIATASERNISVDINKVPVNTDMIRFCETNNLNYKDFIKWGGEDYELVLCLPESLYNKLNPEKFIKIGTVLNKDKNPSIYITDNKTEEIISKKIYEEKSFNHFVKM